MPKAYDDEQIKALAEHGVHVFTHQLRSSAEMRAALQRKIDAGEPLGASHVTIIKPGVYTVGTLKQENPYGRTPNQRSPRGR